MLKLNNATSLQPACDLVNSLRMNEELMSKHMERLFTQERKLKEKLKIPLMDTVYGKKWAELHGFDWQNLKPLVDVQRDLDFLFRLRRSLGGHITVKNDCFHGVQDMPFRSERFTDCFLSQKDNVYRIDFPQSAFRILLGELSIIIPELSEDYITDLCSHLKINLNNRSLVKKLLFGFSSCNIYQMSSLTEEEAEIVQPLFKILGSITIPKMNVLGQTDRNFTRLLQKVESQLSVHMMSHLKDNGIDIVWFDLYSIYFSANSVPAELETEINVADKYTIAVKITQMMK